MRRFAVVLFAAPLLTAAAQPSASPDAGAQCLNNGLHSAGAQPGTAGFHRLDQLPPANEILTVIHTEDGCMKPVIVRYGIGGNPSAGK